MKYESEMCNDASSSGDETSPIVESVSVGKSDDFTVDR